MPRERLLQIARELVNSTEPSEERVQTLAYRIWEERGRPDGDPEYDWNLAQQLLDEVESEPISQRIVFRYSQVGSQARVAEEFGVTRYQVRKALGNQSFAASL